MGLFCALNRRCAFFLSLASTICAYDHYSEKPPPSWQTVFPDTNVIVPLSGDEGPRWNLESSDGEYYDIPARVPGDVLTDLMVAGKIGDPYFSRNFLTQNHVWMGSHDPNNETWQKQRTRTWNYRAQIPMEIISDGLTWILVLEGVKMAATVSWNGIDVGVVNDQFLRYTFAVGKNMLDAGALFETLANPRARHLGHRRFHELSISFDPTIGTNGRFMACSGGWDWAPYSRSVDNRGSPVFSFGIVKPVYLVAVKSLFISHVVPRVYYKGPYPREPMRDGPMGDFAVIVDVHLQTVHESPETGDVLVVVARANFTHETVFANVSYISPGETDVVTLNMVASKDEIQLWWPNGLGDQILYNIEVSLQDSSFNIVSHWVQKRIGFRTTALVTVNDTDDSVVADILANNSEGSGSHGMYFRINGAAIWGRGANFVPMDELEGRLDDRAHRIAVESAAAAHMNMLRVWGGGMILPDAFYDACDENGILLYHDMMFVEEQGHGALRSQTVENEMRHIIRWLASHVSIIVWNGCNECTYVDKDMDVYTGYVMSIVAEEDDTRSIWPTSPSEYGWKTGVYRLDGRPNGRPLTTAQSDRTSQKPIENHGPYQHGWSKTHPAVNGHFDGRKYETNTPPNLKKSQTGVVFPNMFTSEFGASVFSSFESMSETLEKRDWGVHGGSPPDTCLVEFGNRNDCNGTNVMAERNYACDSHILAYFGNTSLDEVGEISFKFQLYLCMISQALWMKGQLEVFRASNSFGTLIWQMNEIWPTGGWGLVEYDGSGQGGRWKPLMNLLRNSLFRDVFVACGACGVCYTRNDRFGSVNATVSLEGWILDKNRSLWEYQCTIALQSGPGTIEWFQLPLSLWNAADVIFIHVVDMDGNELMAETTTFLHIPGSITTVASKANVSVTVLPAKNHALVTIETDRVSLYVTLSALANGRFTENSFHIKPGTPKIVTFKTFTDGAVDVDLLKRTLRVDLLMPSKI